MRIIILVLIALLIYGMYALISYAYNEEKKFLTFVRENNCVEQSRSWNPPLTMYIWNGTMMVPQIIPQPDTVHYKCDNGITAVWN